MSKVELAWFHADVSRSYLCFTLHDTSDVQYELGLLTHLLIGRWSIGSVLFLASWAVLMGPIIYVKHLISEPRLPFTAAYFGSIGMTLFSAIGVSALLPPTSFSCSSILLPNSLAHPLPISSEPCYKKCFERSLLTLMFT